MFGRVVGEAVGGDEFDEYFVCDEVFYWVYV